MTIQTTEQLIAWLGNEAGKELIEPARNLERLTAEELQGLMDWVAAKLDAFRTELTENIDVKKRALDQAKSVAETDVGRELREVIYLDRQRRGGRS